MNFVFENLQDLTNFVECPDVNGSGIRRFAPSPLADYSLKNGDTRFSATDTLPNDVIIVSGVNHHPNDWTGSSYVRNNTRTTVFSHLSADYLTRLQQGRAILILDQSLEGYQTTWLWDYFHTECRMYEVDPRAVVYVTGNLIADEQYNAWATEHNIQQRIKVIPYMHFERDVRHIATQMNLVSDFDKNLEYKLSHNIKTYNCLQKRGRVHRSWFYLYLFKNNLLDAGLVSTNHYGNHIPDIDGVSVPLDLLEAGAKLLPRVIKEPNNVKDDNYYIRRILPDICLDTWVSVISEASFVDSENTLFLSEKMFKPIACMHPFIILGNRNSLQKLRDMGYRTFDGFIDQSYDTLPTFERFDAIIEAIKKIDAIEDKAEWYRSMRDILEHNYQVFCASENKNLPAQQELINYYNEYFKI